jgi:hypothetical protein
MSKKVAAMTLFKSFMTTVSTLNPRENFDEEAGILNG